MAAKQQAQPDLSLLDMSIDDIDDLPGFAVPENGTYSMKFSTSVKVVNDKNCIESAFEVIDMLELNDPLEDDEEMPASSKPGTKFSMLTMIENEVAMGKFKAMVLPICAHFGERNILKLVTDTCKADNNVIIAASVKQRFGKKGSENEDRVFADVSNIVVS